MTLIMGLLLGAMTRSYLHLFPPRTKAHPFEITPDSLNTQRGKKIIGEERCMECHSETPSGTISMKEMQQRTDKDLFQAIYNGKYPNGRSLFTGAPYRHYLNTYPDSDIHAVIAYIRNIPHSDTY